MLQSIREIRFTTVFVQRCAALFISVLLMGCGKDGDDNSADTPDPSTAKAQIRAALPEAAGIPIDEFDATFREDYAPPSLAKAPSQSLTHIFFFLGRPVADAHPDKLDAEFDRVDVIVDPSKITRAISACRDQGYVSVIQKDNIDAFTCNVSGMNATGQVEFKLKDFCKAKVNYAAQFKDNTWQISEFAVPTWQAKTVRQDDGTWRACGEGLFPTLTVYVPAVKGLPARKDSPNRLVIAIGYIPNLKGPAVGKLSFAISGRTATETDLGELLSAASLELAEQRKIRRQQMIFVIRPNFDVPTKLIRKLVARLRAEQFEQIRLAGSIREDWENLTRGYLAPGEVAISMLDALPTSGNYDESIHVRLKPDKSGELDTIEIKTPLNSFTCDDEWEMQKRLMEYSNGGAFDFAVVFDVDDRLIYRSLLKTLSAAAGYYDEDRKWIPLASELRLVPPAPDSR